MNELLKLGIFPVCKTSGYFILPIPPASNPFTDNKIKNYKPITFKEYANDLIIRNRRNV